MRKRDRDESMRIFARCNGRAHVLMPDRSNLREKGGAGHFKTLSANAATNHRACHREKHLMPPRVCVLEYTIDLLLMIAHGDRMAI